MNHQTQHIDDWQMLDLTTFRQTVDATMAGLITPDAVKLALLGFVGTIAPLRAGERNSVTERSNAGVDISMDHRQSSSHSTDYARVAPHQNLQLVDATHRMDHFVAMEFHRWTWADRYSRKGD